MIEVSSEEIISQKTLPYDIYDEAGIKILEAGEILTPGKILLVRNYEVLFRKELKEEEEQEVNEIKEKVIETPEQEQETIEDFGPINKKSKLDFQSQYELKCDYNNAMDFFNRNDVIRAKSMILETRDKIIKNSQLIRKNAKFFSELKLLGEYKNIHPLNTAIYSVFLANKLEYNEAQIMEIALSALLHDIGKCKLEGEIAVLSKMTKEEEIAYKNHPIVGHKLIKTELKLNENIARVALQHHERMDGTGWPYGISSTMISEYAQIIAVCNYFDNMTSTNANLEISNFREALRALLKVGSKAFSPKPLYAFVHMLNYGDSATFEELKL